MQKKENKKSKQGKKHKLLDLGLPLGDEEVLKLPPLSLFKLFMAIHRLSSVQDVLPQQGSTLQVIKQIADNLGVPLKNDDKTLKTKKDMIIFIPQDTIFIEAYEAYEGDDLDEYP